MAKMTKEETDYSKGHQDSHCGPLSRNDKYYCKHFRQSRASTGTCTVVEGDIKPDYWCTEFEKIK